MPEQFLGEDVTGFDYREEKPVIIQRTSNQKIISSGNGSRYGILNVYMVPTSNSFFAKLMVHRNSHYRHVPFFMQMMQPNTIEDIQGYFMRYRPVSITSFTQTVIVRYDLDDVFDLVAMPAEFEETAIGLFMTFTGDFKMYQVAGLTSEIDNQRRTVDYSFTFTDSLITSKNKILGGINFNPNFRGVYSESSRLSTSIVDGNLTEATIEVTEYL